MLIKKGRTNWKYILIVIILAAAVGGGILGYRYWCIQEYEVRIPEIKPPGIVFENETADWKTYRNEEYGFEIKYPKEWLIIEDNLRKNITDPIIANWGDPDEHCLFFDTDIDRENRDVIVHLFISDNQWAKNLCDRKNICHYDKNNPIFANEVEIYEWTGSSAYDWVVEGKDKFIGVFRILDMEEGIGYMDRIGNELRQELDKSILTMLKSAVFK